MAVAMETFAEKLRRLRQAASLSQMQLAVRAGLSLGTIRQYESGNREPAYAMLQSLAKALGVSLAAFDDPPESPTMPEPEEPAPKPKRTRRTKGEQSQGEDA